MTVVESSFVNEIGNNITISVHKGLNTVSVHAEALTGPNVGWVVEHVWTPLEARKLKDLLALSV